MSGGLTIWLRQRLADIQERVRELFRRQVRKLVELVLTDIDLMARRIAIPHPRGGTIDVTAPLPPHMQQSWNLLGLDAARYDPIVEAPEE